MMYVRDDRRTLHAPSDLEAAAVWLDPPSRGPDQPRFHDDPLLDAILARRLASPLDVADFLDHRPRTAPDPLVLPGMPEAVERIVSALRGGEAIGVFGDYDTDGVTSAAVVTLALRAASGGIQPLAVRLPLRREGYGLSVTGVDDLADAGVKLLIAVDCGSKDHEAVDRARARGLDVVILDHHRLTGPPPAAAILASAQCRDDAPYRTMSTAGLALLLATALARAEFDAGDGTGQDPISLLDLAMIGLIGDVSTLAGPNRAIVRDGLRQVRTAPRTGLRAMSEVGGIDLARLSSTDVAFQISPRLNAPGRLEDPRPGFELLIASSPTEAMRHAQQTEQANRQRKTLQERVLREVEEALRGDPGQLERRVLVFAGTGWEAGIVGLAASKLADRFDRPVIVLSRSAGEAHGSARSVPGFDITAALTGVAPLLTRFGGHERAAGLALPEANLPALDEALQVAIEDSGAPEPGPPRLAIDAELEPRRLNLETARLIQTLGPFGEGNPVPLLRVSGIALRDYLVMGRERQHLKLRVGEGVRSVDALLWSGAGRSRELLGAREVDLVGTLETNEWNGSTRVQMRLADFRPVR